VGLRLAASGLALVALLASLAGAGGLASLLLLVAIVGAGARLLEAVGDVAKGASDRVPVVASVATLVIVLGAAATRTPTIVLCVLAPLAVDVLCGVRPSRQRLEVPTRPVLQDLASEFADPSASRAA
jgi:hypothetical protein